MSNLLENKFQRKKAEILNRKLATGNEWKLNINRITLIEIIHSDRQTDKMEKQTENTKYKEKTDKHLKDSIKQTDRQMEKMDKIVKIGYLTERVRRTEMET